MSTRSNIDILRDIATIAQGLARLSTSSALPISKPHSSSSSECQVNECAFPPPKSLTPELTALGLRFTAAERISDTYLQAAMRLKARFETHYRRISRVYLQNSDDHCTSRRSELLLQSANVSMYTRMLQAWADEIMDKMESRLAEIRRSQVRPDVTSASDQKRSRRPFNQNVLPILQQFFEHNAFPSRSERQDLATKTGLEYRQINIWFQNRRTRFKRDGKQLRRNCPFAALPSEVGNAVAVILSSHEAQDETDMKGDKYASSHKSSTVTGTIETQASFSLERPLHAYPSSYPPSCPYNPFPIQEDIRTFSTPWIRKPPSSCNYCSAAIDVTQLTDLFAKLTLVAKAQKGPPPIANTPGFTLNTPKAPGSCLLASIGFATLPPRAPLPALLPTTMATIRPVFVKADDQPSSWSSYTPFKSASPNSPVLQSNDLKARKSISKRKVGGSLKDVSTGTSTRLRGSITPSSGVRSLTPGASNSYVSGLVSSSGNTERYISTQRPRCPKLSTSMTNFTLDVSSSQVESDLMAPPYYQSYSAVRGSTSRKKTEHLPKRAPTAFSACPPSVTSDPLVVSALRSVPTPSRLSSISSISSVSSSESSSPSSSDSDGPVTPPLLPTSLETLDFSEPTVLPHPSADLNGLFDEPFASDYRPRSV